MSVLSLCVCVCVWVWGFDSEWMCVCGWVFVRVSVFMDVSECV